MFDKKEYMEKYYIDNKEKIKEQHNQWQKKNPKYQKDWRKENKEHIKKYLKNNHGKILKQDNQWRKDKRKTDLKYNLNSKIRIAMWESLKGKKAGKHWGELVGYSLKKLIKRLKKTMPEGYTWQDYMEGRLNIDHIIPISAFNFTKPEHPDFERCWALKNLRLLTAKENNIKRAKLTKPFQPALKIFKNKNGGLIR